MGREIGLKEHQQIMLQILKDFANFCDCHNLTYFLDAGTLLGAVRHGGFIPWDNDADVCLLRTDFNKLIDILSKQNFMLNDHLRLVPPTNTIYTSYKLCDLRTQLIEFPKNYPMDCYIYVDIFCKDGLPANLNKAKKICDKSEKMMLFHWFCKFSIPYWSTGAKGFLKKIIARTANLLIKNKNIAINKQSRFISKINNKYPLQTCKYVVTLSNGEFFRICKKECFDNFVIMPFEDISFNVPIGYKEWLEVLYGKNYMNLPPIEKRKSHTIIAKWRAD